MHLDSGLDRSPGTSKLACQTLAVIISVCGQVEGALNVVGPIQTSFLLRLPKFLKPSLNFDVCIEVGCVVSLD